MLADAKIKKGKLDFMLTLSCFSYAQVSFKFCLLTWKGRCILQKSTR